MIRVLALLGSSATSHAQPQHRGCTFFAIYKSTLTFEVTSSQTQCNNYPGLSYPQSGQLHLGNSQKNQLRRSHDPRSITMSGSNLHLATSRWSGVTESREYVDKLRLLCHSVQELKKAGYVVESLSQAQLESKLRCRNCGSMTLPSINSNGPLRR